MKRALRIQIVVLCMLLTALVPPTLAAAAADYEFQDTTPTTPILSPTAPSTAMRYPTVVGDGLNLALWYEDRSASPTVIKMRTSTTGYTGFGAATTTTGLTGLGHPRIYADGAGGFVGYFWDTSQVPPNGLKRLTSPDGVAWQDSTDISIASSPFPGEKIWGVVGYFENVTGSTDVLYFTQATGANEQLYRATATDGVSFTYTGRAFQNSGAFSTGTGVIVGSQIVFDTLQNQYTLIYTGSTPSGALGYASSSDGITFTQQEVVLPVNANHTLFKETAFLINGGLLMGFYTGTFAGVTGTSLGVYISADPPTVTSVSPAVGPTVGANSVTVTGTNLTGATAVVFGGTESTDYTIDSPTTITATVPAHATGVVDVEVSTPGGADTLVGGYTYGTAPSITSGDTTSGTAGPAMTPFTVTPPGTPTPALTHTGALPNGVSFTDNTNGTRHLGRHPHRNRDLPPGHHRRQRSRTQRDPELHSADQSAARGSRGHEHDSDDLREPSAGRSIAAADRRGGTRDRDWVGHDIGGQPIPRYLHADGRILFAAGQFARSRFVLCDGQVPRRHLPPDQHVPDTAADRRAAATPGRETGPGPGRHRRVRNPRDDHHHGSPDRSGALRWWNHADRGRSG